MKCVICKHGETSEGVTSVPLERDGMLFILKNVPAHICSNCGEAYLSDQTTKSILHLAEEAHNSGVQLGVYNYKAA